MATAVAKKKKESTVGGDIRVKITLMEDMLGTASADPEVYKSYIAAKAPDAKSVEDELQSISVEEFVENAMTVFHRLPDDPSTPIIYDYLIKGFLKNAVKANRECKDTVASNVSAYKTKIDNLVFVYPRRIKFDLNGKEMAICERPLRASTAQGERIALASSETIPAGSTAKFRINAMNGEMYNMVLEALEYGCKNGLGQWHNSGKGRFVYEAYNMDGELIASNMSKLQEDEEW